MQVYFDGKRQGKRLSSSKDHTALNNDLVVVHGIGTNKKQVNNSP
jgi:hypothetical protein